MAKVKTTTYGLRKGHPMPFRRTVNVGRGASERKVILVFEPDKPYELTDQEVAGLAEEIKCGLLVAWSSDPEDHRGRQRPPRSVPLEPTNEPAAVAASGPDASEEFDEAELALSE